MKKHIWFVPVNPPRYQPRYPEYKWRCRMRCWDIWRCWGPIKKWKELLSYEQIIALSSDDAVTELNSAPEEYYNKLFEEWHIANNLLMAPGGNTIYNRDEPCIPYVRYSWTRQKRCTDS